MSDIVERFNPCNTEACKKRCDSFGVCCEEICIDEIESLRQLVDLWKTTAENQKTALTDLRQRVAELEYAIGLQNVPAQTKDELAALKQSQGEPVAWMTRGGSLTVCISGKPSKEYCIPLYTTPTIPEGWQLVPKEPDYSLLLKMTDDRKAGWQLRAKAAYYLLLAAAPKHEDVK